MLSTINRNPPFSSAPRGIKVASESSDDPKSPSPPAERYETPLPQPPQINTSQVTMSSPRVAIVISSMHGHISKMAEAAKQGVMKAGGQAGIFQMPETLSPEILAQIHAPPKLDYPIITTNDITKHDGCLFAVPTHSNNISDQWKTLEPIKKMGTILFKTFSCFFLLFQLYRTIMKSRESMKKLRHLLAKLLQLFNGWYSAFEADD